MMPAEDIHVEFDAKAVKEMADKIAEAVGLFQRVESDLDASMQQLRNAAFKGIVGDDVLRNYEANIKNRLHRWIARATELSDDFKRIASMMESYGGEG